MTTNDITVCRGPRGWLGVIDVGLEAIVDPHPGRRTAYGAAMAARAARRGLREQTVVLIPRSGL